MVTKYLTICYVFVVVKRGFGGYREFGLKMNLYVLDLDLRIRFSRLVLDSGL